MTSFSLALYAVLAPLVARFTTVPQPEAKMPDWARGFTTILNWASWFALGVCVLGVIISGGAMALASRRGEGGEHATRLGWVLAACVVIGSASGIVSGVLAG